MGPGTPSPECYGLPGPFGTAAARVARKRWGWGLLLSLCLGLPGLLTAAPPLKNVSLAWDPVEGAAGYRIYYGASHRRYPHCLATGQSTQATLPNLRAGAMYYFAVTAYNAEGVESAYSTEIRYRVPFPIELRLTLTGATNLVFGGVAQPGHWYEIQATRELTVWQTIGRVRAAANGAIRWRVPLSKNEPGRFFRLHDVTHSAPGSSSTSSSPKPSP